MSSPPQHPEPEDRKLLEAYQQSGDARHLAQLFMRYTHLVLGVCLKYLKNREESEDAVMQIYEKLQIELPKREVQNFAPWLHRVAQNHCLMQLRKAKSQARKQADFEKDLQSDMENAAMPHHEDKSLREGRIEKLPAALAALPAEQKRCVELFFFEEKSYQEVAHITGYSLKAVKSHLQNGKRNLKKTLGPLVICLLFVYQYLMP